jgi:hypothetical protein
VKTAAIIVGFVLLLAGFFGFAWPFPLFTINEPFLGWYVTHVLGVDDWGRPGGSAAALPFLWLLTAPAGVGAAAIGLLLLHWGQSK